MLSLARGVAALLPLLAAGAAAARDKPEEADNSRCLVCHINYQEEKLAVDHARAGIGCAKCHGESNAHCEDEENITAPDILYERERINAFCMECHPVHKQALEPYALKKNVCTDCHGKHRLDYRTRRWDKKTRRLIEKK